MTIREVIAILVDAPDKDKEFIAEFDISGNNTQWVQLDVVKLQNCTCGSVAELRKQEDR